MCIRDRSFTWIPVDEWITGKQGHCTKDLSAGKYRLIEIKAADGFKLLAKPIEFTVTDGLEEVPRLIMRNYSTIVEVQKTKAGTDTLLAGARLQLIQTENDRIIREWTSEEESGQIFYGLDPGIYRIHEVQAPSGYKKAQDQEITVEDSHQSVQVFRFENRDVYKRQAADRVNPDTGDVETLIPSGSGSDFNFVAFAQEDFEDTYYRTRIRIEKLDGETGENIIHDGALFKLYAAKRDVAKNGTGAVAGTGDVLFGKAVDWEGNPVKDADGNHILYPRVGQSNADNDDLPIRLDREGIPQYDETQLVKQEDREGNETGIFRAYSTVREVTIDGQAQKVPVGYIVTYKPLGAGAYVLVEIQAPEGYTKSRPAAFEIYGDDVIYYSEQRNTDGTTKGWEPEPAVRYQYAVPVPGESDMFRTETVSRINVQDYPSRIEIRKVEDGDSMTGNQNGLQRTDNPVSYTHLDVYKRQITT